MKSPDETKEQVEPLLLGDLAGAARHVRTIASLDRVIVGRHDEGT